MPMASPDGYPRVGENEGDSTVTELAAQSPGWRGGFLVGTAVGASPDPAFGDRLDVFEVMGATTRFGCRSVVRRGG